MDSQDYVAGFAQRTTLAPAHACLVLVDFQRALGRRDAGLGRLLREDGRAHEAVFRWNSVERQAVPNAARLLARFRELGLERLFLTVGSQTGDYEDLVPPLRRLCSAVGARVGAAEHAILPELAPRPGEPVLNKTSFSAFASTTIEDLLRERGITMLAFAGLTTNMCVEHTLRDAADRGFGCVLVEDACAADSPEMHQAAVRNVSRLYGTVTGTDDLLHALERRPAVAGSA